MYSAELPPSTVIYTYTQSTLSPEHYGRATPDAAGYVPQPTQHSGPSSKSSIRHCAPRRAFTGVSTISAISECTISAAARVVVSPGLS